MWAALDAVQRGFLALLGVRWLLCWLFLLNILPLDLRAGWYLHHGGDQDLMFSLARSIITGVPEESVVGIAQSLVMIPWVILLQPYYYVEMVVPLVVINGFLLGGLSVPVVGGIARAVTRDGRAALVAAGLWALLPLVAYFAFFWHPAAVVLSSSNVPKLAWLNGLSDGPATFFLLAATLILARSLGKREASFWAMVGVGAALSIAVMYRVHTFSVVGFLVLYVLAAHGWRACLAVCGAGLIVYLPQAWYNLVAFGLPFTTGYVSYRALTTWGRHANRPLMDLLTSLPFHPFNFPEAVVYLVGRYPWLVAPLLLALIVGGYVVFVLWRRRGWQAMLLLVGASLAYLAPMLMAYNFREDIIRFAMPVIPAAIIVMVFALFDTWERLSKRRAGGHSGGPQGQEK